MLRYYWTFFVAGMLLLFIALPVVLIGHILRKLFGIEDFIAPYVKFGCGVYVRSTGARVHISGYEHLNPRQAYVFISNHQSALDPPLLIIAPICHITGAIAKKELERVPVFKQGFPLAHVVPIDRKNRQNAIASTKRGAAELARGYSLMAFPEGTRSADGQVLPFKKGVFFMALEAGVPIAPVVINDTALVMPKGVRRCIPGDVYVEFLPPVSTAGYTEENIDVLIEKVRSQIAPRVRPIASPTATD